MGRAERKFDVIQGGCFELTSGAPKQPSKQPQNNLAKWLVSSELEVLSGVSQAAVHKALSKRFWRGADLLVREERTGRGRGGKTLMVHVDSLPANLREAWYLSQGIQLHEKPTTEPGQTMLVPEQAYENDKQFEADFALARFRHELIRPALSFEAGTAERSRAVDELAAGRHLFPNGKRKAVTRQTIYNWIRAAEADGLNGLLRKRRSDKRGSYQSVTRAWDAFFEAHTDQAARDKVSDELTTYIRSLWASGGRGWRSISEMSTTRLIELSRGLRVVAFDALDTGRCGDTSSVVSQFGVCHVNRRLVERERSYQIIAVKDKDNAVFQDKYMPSITRDYSSLLPRQIVVGDVHPVDIMMRRPDGTVVYPKAIAWYDVATNEIHMTFVLLEPGEGIRREHVAMSFQAMVDEWGLPSMLYLDNGSEYSWDAMIGGFTMLSKLTNAGFKVNELDGDPNVARRVREGREAITRSRPYNAKGKPGIEGAFGNLEQVFFATIPGWTAGDRMNKKTHAKGKDPVAFNGDASDFLDVMAGALEHYHKRPQHGRLSGKSPNEVLRDFINEGWGKTVLSDTNVLALAFSEEVERMPDRGRITYTPRRGSNMTFYSDELLGMDRKITVRVPAFNPEFVFCFDGDKLICKAFPERKFAVLDPMGAEEVNRRAKAFRRQIAERKRHVALLSLVDETARHNTHMPDAPDAPVAAVVDAGILDRMAALPDREAQEAMAEEARAVAPEQWKTGPDEALENFEFAED